MPILIIFLITSIVFGYWPLSQGAISKCSLERNILPREQELNVDNYRLKALFDSENSVVSDNTSLKTTLKQLIRTTNPSTRNGIVTMAGFEALNVQLYRKAFPYTLVLKVI